MASSKLCAPTIDFTSSQFPAYEKRIFRIDIACSTAEKSPFDDIADWYTLKVIGDSFKSLMSTSLIDLKSD